MRRCALALVSALILCVPGCYVSDVPLSSSEESAIDSELLGGWIEVVKPNEETGERAELPILVGITQFNDHEYLACWQEAAGPDSTVARAYSVTVGDAKILNVQLIVRDQPHGAFMFFKYAFLDKDRLVLQMMNGGSPPLKDKEFKTSEEFMAFIKEHLADETLFGEPVEFKRAEGLKVRVTIEKD